MEKYYNKFVVMLDNNDWHYQKYGISENKIMRDMAELQKQIDLYYVFNLLTSEENQNLRLKMQEIVNKYFIYM